MANPIAPVDGGARRIPYLIDPANPGIPYLGVGSGAIDMGADRTDGAVAGALGWGLGTDEVPLQHHVADTFVPFSLTAVTTEQLAWDPAVGKKVRVLAIVIKASAETNVNLLDGTGGATVLTVPCAAGVPFYLPLGAIGKLSATADNAIYLTSSASANLAGTLMGCEEDVAGS